MLTLNFPWMGRNPYRIGLLICLLFSVVMLPAAAVKFKANALVAAVEDALLPVGFGAIFLFIGLAVRRRLRRIVRSSERSRPAAYCVDCLLAHGAKHMPATLAVADGKLSITPLFGSTVTVPLAQLGPVKFSRWFNGIYLFRGAGGLALPAVDGRRLGIAVPDVITFGKQLSRTSTAA